MSTRLLVAQNGGSKIYALGRTGFDSGTADVGGVYSALLRTDPLSPDGEDGLTHFRRIMLRVRHTGAFVCIMRCYVDGAQTQIYSGGVLTNQAVTFTKAAPTFYPAGSEAETLLEMDINARGTFIVIELAVDSDDITGVFLIESAMVGRRTIRPGRQQGASTS